MLLSYITVIIAAIATAVATPAFEVSSPAKRQVVPAPVLFGPFRLRFEARWATYRNRYAFVEAFDAVRPAALASASVFNYENSTGRLWVGSNPLVATVGGLRLNLTSNLAPLAFGSLFQVTCISSGGVTYQTSFNFTNNGSLTLGGVSTWHGCTTRSSIGLGAGINFQFGAGPSSTLDCQDVFLQHEAISPSTS
ncbi:hypothetical protein DRE_00913 [Drechslerella stenobrocha 248]|uniref:Uncharacterized protein n=1 Tax=Drechslerella stenobrocha 248 TaxID=1043628 RepID=W7HNY1_9PEZI|nr:hypothetical protein DRE_00913 [Drechslerella stenobrocha 248]